MEQAFETDGSACVRKDLVLPLAVSGGQEPHDARRSAVGDEAGELSREVGFEADERAAKSEVEVA